MFKTPHDIMLYAERTEAQEFGRPQRNYQACGFCGSVYFNKSWHHAAALLGRAPIEPRRLWLTHCPACRMVQHHQYEGMLTIKRVPHKFHANLYSAIKAFAERAYRKDCQHRIIKLEKKNSDTWVVTTTENQLAYKLGRHIKRAFNSASLEIQYSEAPNDVERVTLSFQPLPMLSLA